MNGKFEVGKTYGATTSVDGYTSTYTYTITARTAKTVMVRDNFEKKEYRCKIKGTPEDEYIVPRYAWYILRTREVA